MIDTYYFLLNHLQMSLTNQKHPFVSKTCLENQLLSKSKLIFYKLHQMSSFEIACQVTWNSLPTLTSIFGLSSQNIVIPHYPCHSGSGRQNMLWPTKKFGIGSEFSAVQWRLFPLWASVVRCRDQGSVLLSVVVIYTYYYFFLNQSL